jgi:hypothetical protein
MRLCLPACAALAVFLSSPAYSQQSTGCAEALVMATYSRIDLSHTDWRLASYVTENEWNTIKRDAGLNVVIYGVPIGASYKEFQDSVKQKTDSYNESLTQDQATNIMWTGLDPNSANAYSECLKAQIFSQPGLHLAVKAATKDQVSVLTVWTPVGDVHTATPQWSWKGGGAAMLPKSVPPGSHVTVLPRPKDAQILAVNFKGYQDSIIVNAFPPPPTMAQVHWEETTQEYRSPEISAWGDQWSPPYALCTDEKPAGWTISKLYGFHLESATVRGGCGSWTTCGGENTDTATHACRVITVQGQNDNKFDGYGRAVAVFQVVWKHPVKN